jgi:hypothetical protein
VDLAAKQVLGLLAAWVLLCSHLECVRTGQSQDAVCWLGAWEDNGLEGKEKTMTDTETHTSQNATSHGILPRARCDKGAE